MANKTIKKANVMLAFFIIHLQTHYIEHLYLMMQNV